MRVLIIGGNGFVGRRLSLALDQTQGVDLHVLNRHGEVRGARRATLNKGNRNDLPASAIGRDWDAVVDFVCFDDRQAIAAAEYFGGAARYVVISSQSVYDLGGDLREADFDPLTVDLSKPAQATDPAGAYQEGKRRTEAAFAQRAPFPTVMVRFPFLLGPDDYSRRLEFHIDRVANGLPLHLPNPEARISMIHAGDACSFLQFAIAGGFSGPVNVASPDPVSLSALVRVVEQAVGKRALLEVESAPEASSPYGPPADYFMNTGLARELGFAARPTAAWLPELVRQKAAERR